MTDCGLFFCSDRCLALLVPMKPRLSRPFTCWDDRRKSDFAAIHELFSCGGMCLSIVRSAREPRSKITEKQDNRGHPYYLLAKEAGNTTAKMTWTGGSNDRTTNFYLGYSIQLTVEQ